jgi:ribosomal protein S18 acetylase RimI-like enzyme
VTGPFVIREATVADVKDILDLETQIDGLTQSRGRAIVEAAVTTHDCLVCIDHSNAVLGYVVFSQKSFFGRDFVRLLEVSGCHRRLGVATALLGDALARCTTNTVFTSTNESNVAMRSLLTRDGWTFSGTLTGIDDGDPELVFWKQRERDSF